MGGKRLRPCAALLALLLASCTPNSTETPSPSPASSTAAVTTAAPSTTTSTPSTSPIPSPGVSVSQTPTPMPSAAPFDVAEVLSTIGHLAGLGPREATGPAFDEAATWVAARFDTMGYTVTSQPFEVPAGNSWGIEVGAGISRNVVASPTGFDPTAPHLVIGAHLDSVPQSPGAEDNASGVAVMLELARMVSQQPATLPIRFIAFGAEEPRGQGDDWHHYGSQHYVAELAESERTAIVAMVALDRVGVPGPAVPVGAGGAGTTVVREQLVDAAGEIPVEVDEPNRASDHWSFDKAGIPATRLGSIPFAGYHSRNDTPDVVDAEQLAAVGAIMWNWLRDQPA